MKFARLYAAMQLLSQPNLHPTSRSKVKPPQHNRTANVTTQQVHAHTFKQLPFVPVPQPLRSPDMSLCIPLNIGIALFAFRSSTTPATNTMENKPTSKVPCHTRLRTFKQRSLAALPFCSASCTVSPACWLSSSRCCCCARKSMPASLSCSSAPQRPKRCVKCH